MKQRIVLIDKDVKTQTLLESYLLEFDFISVNDHTKGVELCKTAAPDLIIIGFLSKSDEDSIAAVRKLKRDLSTNKVPIIGFYHNLDRVQLERDHKEGVEAYITKPINKEILIAKIKECMNNARAQRQYDSFKNKNHIKVENITPILVKISFLSGLKYVLPEVKNIFNNEFLISLKSKDCCMDIRDFPSISKEDAIILEKIVSIFGQKRIAVIVGKHMGPIISHSNLENRADLFMNLEDYIEFLKKPKTKTNMDSI
ncbi:MAG: hypothetical protein IPL26_09245 [Leptospiraceae bacterium]|nr:hypothetical protein [Leptospiraceae bacterium]